MAIIISQNGKNAVKVEKSTFDKEDFLQRYIYENPESIPLYDIKEDVRLLILAREFQTSSGPVDALALDKDGQIYVIETKLFRNADKRTVIAQVLDYGAALWKHSGDFASFNSALDSAMLETFGTPLGPKLREFFGLSEEENASLLENARRNLSDGRFRFVVLMDRLDSRLKDLLTYVNRNSQFDVYAVEFEYYKHLTHHPEDFWRRSEEGGGGFRREPAQKMDRGNYAGRRQGKVAGRGVRRVQAHLRIFKNSR